MLRTLILALIAAVAMPAMASAQFGWNDTTEYFVSQVQVAGSRIAEQELAKAKKDLENGEFERCIRLVQNALDFHGTRALSTDSGRFMGIREFCNDFIRKIPAEGRETYRRIYDPYAGKLYKRGIAERDLGALKEVFFRYLNTSYGKDSLLASISMLLEQGRFHDLVDTALLFRETFADDEANGVRAIAALALGARMLGDRERLEALQRDLPKSLIERTVLIEGRSRKLGEFIDEALSAIFSAPAGSSMQPPPADMFSRPQWTAGIDMQPWTKNAYSELLDFGEKATPNHFQWNPVIPLVDESSVYVTNGVSVAAIGVYSHQEKWRFTGPVNGSQARRNLSATFPMTLDRNVIYAPLETKVKAERRIWSFVPQQPVPHRQLFAIDASSGNEIWTHHRWRSKSATETQFIAGLNVNSNPLIHGDCLYVAATKFHTSYHHYLCCFDRRTGSLMWSTFICTGQMEQNMFGNRVREALAGNLAKKDGVIYYSTNIGVVAAVDSRLGTLRFTVEYEQIQIPRQTRFNNAVQERAPAWSNTAPYVIGDHLYVAPMDSNDVLAINRHTGKFRRTPLRRNESNRYRYLVGPYKNLIIAAGARIAFYDTKDDRMVAPEYDFGGSSRRGRNRRSGILGRPVIIGNRLYACVSSRGTEKIVVWDLDQLRVVDEERFMGGDRKSAWLGNIVASDEISLIAATDNGRRTTQIKCYFDRAKIRVRLENAIRNSPGSPQLHFRAGEFELQGGSKDYAKALKSFTAAWELARTGPVSQRTWAERSRDALYRLYIELARKPKLASSRVGISDLECYERALTVARDRAQQVDILFLLLKRSMDQRDWKTFDRYATTLTSDYADDPYDYRAIFRREVPELPITRRYPHAGMVASLVGAVFSEKMGRHAQALDHFQEILRSYPNDSVGRVTTWILAYERVGKLIEERGPSIYAAQQNQAELLFRQAKDGGGTGLLRQILDHFPNSSLVTDAYLEISKRHLEEGRPDVAVHCIHEYFWRFGDTTGSALHQLGRALEERGCEDSARQVWRYAADLEPDTVVQTPDGRVRLGDVAKKRLDALGSMTRATHYKTPSYGLDAKEVWRKGRDTEPTDWVLLKPKGRSPASMSGSFLVYRGGQIICLDVSNGEQRWSTSARSIPYKTLRWFDGRLIGLVDGDLVCVDPDDGEELWRASITEQQMTTLACGQGKVYTLVEAHGYSQRFRIQARSLLDGEIVFDASFEGVPFKNIYVSHRWLLVPLETRANCLVLDAFTGKPAPAYKDGFDYNDIMMPILSADGMIVSVSHAPTRDQRNLYAVDPATGKTEWSRRLGSGSIAFFHDDPFTMVYKITNAESQRATLMMVDLESGSSLLKRDLGKDIDVSYETAITPKDVFIICRRVVSRGGMLLYCEDIELSTDTTRWRSANFNRIQAISVSPFKEGVVLKVIELLRRGDRRQAQRRTTLYFADRKSGRIKNQYVLDDKAQLFYQEILHIVDGHLIVADGAVLKVFKP